jgi:hypothetical protein
VAWSSGRITLETESLGGENGPVWKKRGTIGVAAPTGQGVAAAGQDPQVVAAKGVTDMHGAPHTTAGPRFPGHSAMCPAPASDAAWEIRGTTVLATQASLILAPPAQPASPRRGTILLRLAWTALCPPLRLIAHAAPAPPVTRPPHPLPCRSPREKSDPCPRLRIVSRVGWSDTECRWPCLRW